MSETTAARHLALSESQFLAASAEAQRIVETPGFRVHLWRTPDTFYRNVAVPTAPLPDWEPAIPAMAAVFREHRRQPMVEYAAERWPQLGPALERAGFAGEVPLIAMACDRSMVERASTVPSGLTLRPLDGSTPIPVLGTYLAALHGLFEARRPLAVGLDEIAPLQRALAAGRTQICMVQGADGRAIAGANLVGIAQVPGIAGPVAELAGVWIAEAARGRGLARLLVGVLLRRFFAGGRGLVWLAADDRLARGLYAGLGFRPIGRLLRYSRDTA